MNSAPLSISVRAVSEIVGDEFGISRHDLISGRRHGPVVAARHATVWLARQHTSKSYPEIGRLLGGRDHTTMLNSAARAAYLIATNPEFASHIANADALCRATAETIVTSGRPVSQDIDAEIVAELIMQSPRHAVRVSVLEIEALAGAVLSARSMRQLAIDAVTARDTSELHEAMRDLAIAVGLLVPGQNPAEQEATHV